MAVTQYKTLQDVIDTENRYDVNGVTIFTKTEDGDLIIRDTDLFTIYMRYIQPFIATYTVTKEQREHYARKPEWLSQDIYGTPELSWLLIMLNDMECASKFYLKSTVKAIPPDRLNDIYDTVITRSNTRVTRNWNTFIPDIGPNEDDEIQPDDWF